MASILVVAHAPLASSLQAVAQHVFPDCACCLGSLDIEAGSGLESVETAVRAAIAALGATEVLILTDVFGATPCNAAMAASDGVHIRVVAGVNVPMVWRALTYAAAPLEELVLRAVDGATQGVMQVSLRRRQNQASIPAHHDQVANQHQQ